MPLSLYPFAHRSALRSNRMRQWRLVVMLLVLAPGVSAQTTLAPGQYDVRFNGEFTLTFPDGSSSGPTSGIGRLRVLADGAIDDLDVTYQHSTYDRDDLVVVDEGLEGTMQLQPGAPLGSLISVRLDSDGSFSGSASREPVRVDHEGTYELVLRRGSDESCAAGESLLRTLDDVLASIPRPAPAIEFIIQRVQEVLADRCVALNDIQMLGTHNSYHLAPREPLFSLMRAILPLAEAWEYSHVPIAQQLEEQGIRQIELDVFTDPTGGRYFFRAGPLLVGESPLGPLSLLRPGMKVLHVQDLDYETHCPLLAQCLSAIKQWSDANPGHLPLLMLMEAKDSPLLPNSPPELRPIAFDAEQLDALDAEIRSIFPSHRLFVPDDLRGNRATLEEAVLADGWPVLGGLRGRLMFLLDNGGAVRDAYRAGRPSLAGRVMFTNSTPGEPDAAFVKQNDALASPALIPALVSAGYLVRTRADIDTREARLGDVSRRDAAFASGAQVVSTDFPRPSPNPELSGYFAALPGARVARCNPVRLVVACRDEGLE